MDNAEHGNRLLRTPRLDQAVARDVERARDARGLGAVGHTLQIDGGAHLAHRGVVAPELGKRAQEFEKAAKSDTAFRDGLAAWE
jgi:cytochrome P450